MKYFKLIENIGLGTWRFFLATAVVFVHLYANALPGLGQYAVWAFYVLSGYLMACVLNEKYGPSMLGTRNFYINRFIRIFPLYWIACAVGFIIIIYVNSKGINSREFNPEYGVPSTNGGRFFAITLFPFVRYDLKFVPVSVALSIEVMSYIMMPLIVFNRRAAWITFLISIIANLEIGISADSFVPRYIGLTTCMCIFSLGVLTYQYKDSLTWFQNSPKLAITCWAINCFIVYKLSIYPGTYGMYVSALLSAWVTISLARINSGKIDTKLGDISYPIYLFHTCIGTSLIPFFGVERNARLFIVGMILTLIASFLIESLVDKKIMKMKIKVPLLNTGKS